MSEAFRGWLRLAFECSQCGECCSHLGLVHTIVKEYGGFAFRLRNRYTGEEQDVAVDSDKRDLFSDTIILEREPEACPFFRFSRSDGRGYCTIHTSRPEICRDFSCWRILILGSGGERVGRVMFRRTLVTGDPDLRGLWETAVDPLPDDDPDRWDRDVIRILTGAGFTVQT